MSTAPQPPQEQPSFPHSGPSGTRSPGEQPRAHLPDLGGAQPRAALGGLLTCIPSIDLSAKMGNGRQLVWSRILSCAGHRLDGGIRLVGGLHICRERQVREPAKHKIEKGRAGSGPGEFPGGQSPGQRRIQMGPVPGL